jgi:tetratricopeptide (TPR) repeat protein
MFGHVFWKNGTLRPKNTSNYEHICENGLFNSMINRFFITFSLALFIGLSGVWPAAGQSGLSNYSIRSPIGPPTVPQSSYRSGLFPSRNPINTTGNQVITGNVADGRHFRGVVPYSAATSFADTLGSTTLDSFMRRSAGTGSIGELSDRYTPYYSLSNTVTTTRPGLSSVIRPPTARTESRTADGFTVTSGGQEQNLAGPDMRTSNINYQPMRYNPQQLERLISDGVMTYAAAKRIVDEQNVGQMERLKRDLGQLQYRAPQSRQSLIDRADPLRPFSKLEHTYDTYRQPEEPKLTGQDKQRDTLDDTELMKIQEKLNKLLEKEQAGDDGKTKKDARKGDVYEQMKQEIESLQRNLESDVRKSPVEEAKEIAAGKEESKKRKSSRDILVDQVQAALEAEEIDEYEAELLKRSINKKEQEEPSDVTLSLKAKKIMGEHKTFASYSMDNFNKHMRAAEQYLKEGKYYRAEDTYTLASLYKPNDPLVYAGKSHALFAAGEYMSSSLFLSRALEIFPEYARFKIDLVAMVGDRDKLESRIGDIVEWIERSGSADLQFLLGYVYYQMGRVEEAKKAIYAAYEKMPNSRAVIALKNAIDSAATGNQSVNQ